MTQTLEVLLTAKDQMTPTFAKVGASAGAMSKQIDAAASNIEKAGSKASLFGKAADKIDSAGRNARIGLSSMGQAASMVGGNLGAIVGPAAAAADAIGDMVGAAASFGPLGIAIGVAVVAVGFLAEQYKKAHTELLTFIKANDESIVKLRDFANSSTDAAAKVDELAEAIAHLREAEAGGGGGPFSAANVIYFKDKIAELEAQIESMQVDKFYTDLENLRASSDHAASGAYAHAKAERDRAAAMAEADAKLTTLKSDTDAYYDSLVKVKGETNAHFFELSRDSQELAKNNNYLDAANRRYGDLDKLLGQRYPISMAAAKDATTDLLNKVKDTSAIDAARRAWEKLRGIVENALVVPDFEQHLKNIANGGKDAFENLFRLDAEATGTPPSQYGAAYEALSKQLHDMGYSAAEAAKGVRDFSIFAAHPELVTSGLIDMAVVVEDVKNQLMGMAGKAAVTKEAMNQVWASLSNQQKAALAEQGINNAGDAIQELEDPAASAKKKVSELGSAIGAIPRSVTTVFTVVKEAATTAIEEFKKVLDDFIAQYQNVTININADANVNPPGAAPDTGTIGGGDAVPPGYARGGHFIVPPGYPHDNYPIRVSSGERVDVTPKGAASAGGNVFNFYVDSFARELRFARRVRALAALGQT